MSLQLVLKDKNAADVTFKAISAEADQVRYAGPTNGSLSGAPEVTLRITRKANVNRVYAKLSVPSVCTDATVCGKPVVKYVEVGSIDLSSVLLASEEDRANFMALFASLAASEAVSAMFEGGISPAI